MRNRLIRGTTKVRRHCVFYWTLVESADGELVYEAYEFEPDHCSACIDELDRLRLRHAEVPR